jgi:hypothetical protein
MRSVTGVTVVHPQGGVGGGGFGRTVVAQDYTSTRGFPAFAITWILSRKLVAWQRLQCALPVAKPRDGF